MAQSQSSRDLCLRFRRYVTASPARLDTSLPAATLAGRDLHPLVCISFPWRTLWPPPTPLSRVRPAFGGRLIPSVTRWVMPRRVEVSSVPFNPVRASHPQYPESPSRLHLVSHPSRDFSLRADFRRSAGPPYTRLFQNNRLAELYETARFTRLRAARLRVSTVWIWGHVCPTLFPRFSHHPRVRHSYTAN